MTRYIELNALVAEIERRRNLHYKYYVKKGAGSIAECKYEEDRDILSFLNTLEVKEVDLEKEIQMFSMDLAMKENNGDWEKDIAVTAKHFFELGLKAQKGE